MMKIMEKVVNITDVKNLIFRAYLLSIQGLISISSKQIKDYFLKKEEKS